MSCDPTAHSALRSCLAMDTLLRDIRYSARKLLGTPGFSAIVIGTLALAIGATTAVFSIVNSVLLKPLPFADPDRLVRVTSVDPSRNPNGMSWADFMDYRALNHTVSAMAAYDDGNRNLTRSGADPLRLGSSRVSANFFSVLGVKPVAGRAFAAGDDAKGAPRTAILAEGVWRNRFGSDPTVVGRLVTLDGKATMIIGVAPSSIIIPENVDVWLPLIPEPDQDQETARGFHYLRGIGRLAPGVSLPSAKADLDGVAAALKARYPDTNARRGATVIPLRDTVVGKVDRALYVMFGCVGFVLLIACANVANLLLVRASTRETEIAVRTALGAGRARLMRQLVTESLLLSALGALFGASLAAWVVDAVRKFGPADLPRLSEITIDARVLGFTAVVAVVTGLVFGLLPAWHAASSNIGEMLKDRTRGSSAHRGAARTRNVLVIAELALAVVLLVGAGLLSQSFVRLLAVDPGYRTDHVVTVSVSLPSPKYEWDQAVLGFVNETLARLRSQPDVLDAGVVFGLPLGDTGMNLSFDRTDRPPSPPDKRNTADIRMVSPGFFSTLRIRTVSGRELAATDRASSPPVVVVSETFAHRYFPNENPLGKHITLSMDRQRSADPRDTVTAGGEIVGVIADIKARGNNVEALATVYLPIAQTPINDLSVVVRSRAAGAATIATTRSQIKAVDPDLSVYDERSMDDVVSGSVAQPRFYALLLAAFAAMAVIIAALGIYGVIAYSVRLRHRELGIRIALGASRERVLKLVMGQGVSLTVVGLLFGLVGASWLTQLIASQLFGVKPIDLVTFATVAVGMLGVAVLACYIPARRAAAVPPVVAMRAE